MSTLHTPLSILVGNTTCGTSLISGMGRMGLGCSGWSCRSCEEELSNLMVIIVLMLDPRPFLAAIPRAAGPRVDTYVVFALFVLRLSSAKQESCGVVNWGEVRKGYSWLFEDIVRGGAYRQGQRSNETGDQRRRSSI